jgi:hypothetical protein
VRHRVVATALTAAVLGASGVNAAPRDAPIAPTPVHHTTGGPAVGPLPGSRVGPTMPRPNGSRWTQRFERDVHRSFYLAPYIPPSEANRYY